MSGANLEPLARCVACGRKYGAGAWRDLAHVRTLSSAEVDAHVIGWPSGRVVEVRGCACGRAIARSLVPTGPKWSACG